MMERMQATVGSLGGEVQFGQKNEDGSFFKKDEKAMARADFEMQMSQVM